MAPGYLVRNANCVCGNVMLSSKLQARLPAKAKERQACDDNYRLPIVRVLVAVG